MAIDLSGYPEGIEGLGPLITDSDDPKKTGQSAAPGSNTNDEMTEEEEPEVGQDENLMQEATSWVRKNFMGQSEEQIQQTRDEGDAFYEEINDKIDAQSGLDSVPRETVRAIAGGFAKAGEGVLNTLDLSGDTLRTVTGLAGDSDNVWSDKYEAANYDFGVAENLSGLGKFARGTVGFLLMMRGAKAVPVLGTVGTKGNLVQRVGGEFIRGAVGDMILSSDGNNLSNQLEDAAPQLADSWLTALSIDDEDNPWMIRLKNTLEGGVLGVAVDGLGELAGAIFAGRRAMKAGGSLGAGIDAAIRHAQASGKAAEAFRARKAAEEIINDPALTKAARDSNKEIIELKNKIESDKDYKGSQASLELDDGSTQLSLEHAGLPIPNLRYKIRPGAALRETEAFARAANENRPSRYNPQQRAFRETEYGPSEAFVSQANAAEFKEVAAASSKPVMTDVAVELVSGGRKEIKEIIEELSDKVDVDAISRELGQSNEETERKAWQAMRDVLVGGEADPEDAIRALDELKFTDNNNNRILSREGVVAAKIVMHDLAQQMADLANNIMDLSDVGQDVIDRQVPMMASRMKSFFRSHKEAAIHYGGGLQAFKIGPFKFGDNKAALAKSLKEADVRLDALVKAVQKGDPQSLQEFKRIANGLVLSGGDPTKQLNFIGLWLRVGGREAMTGIYNSMLSSPLSQVRNIFGSLTTVSLRPIAMTMGSAMSGDFTRAKAQLGAFHSMSESISEAFKVFKTSMKTGVPVNQGQKYVQYSHEALKEIQMLKGSAGNRYERNAAYFLENLHAFTDSPFGNLPTRTLTATDDFFKTLVGRMETKRQVFIESMDDGAAGIKFDENRYAELVEKNFGVNGDILDEKILQTAKEATFQQDLQGAMSKIAGLQNELGAIKYFVPFIRTPHNILVYAGTHTPFVASILPEFRQAMKSGDPDKVAEMMGRQALGSMAAIHAVHMALHGNLTGAGPVDRKKRKVWLQSHQPFSIKIAGRWFSYQAIEPLGTIFGAAADVTQLANVGATDAYDKSLAQLAFTIAAATTDRSYFEGLKAAISFLDPEEQAKGTIFQKTGYDLVNNLVPYAGARRQLAKALAPGMYEWRDELDRSLANAIPGYALVHSVPKIDIFTGEQIEGHNGNIFNNVLPFNISDKKNDKTIKAMSDLGISVSLEFTDRLRGQKLEPEQKMRLTKYIAETGLKKKLDDIVGDTDWQNMVSDWEKKKLANPAKVVPAKDTLWYEKITIAFEDAKEQAVNRFEAEDDEFRDKVQGADNARLRAGRGDFNPVENEVTEFIN